MSGANKPQGYIATRYDTLADLLADSNNLRDKNVASVFEVANRGDWYISTTDEGSGQAIPGTNPQLYANQFTGGGGGMFMTTAMMRDIVNLPITGNQGDSLFQVTGSGRVTLMSVNSTTGVASINVIRDGTTIYTGTPNSSGSDQSSVGVVSNQGGDNTIFFESGFEITLESPGTTARTLNVKYDLGTF